MKRIEQYVVPFFLFSVSLFLFTWGVSSQEIISFDSRFYLFAQEMWQHGLSWFPTTYAKPYADYTSASTVLIYASATLFGGLNKFTAILPSAIVASAVVAMTYLVGLLHHQRWGWHAVAMLLLTATFFKSARTISLDMYSCFIVVTCFYLVHSAKLLNLPQRFKWIYPLIVIGFMFRGPIGLVMPAGVICVYLLLTREFKRFFIFSFVTIVLLLLATTLLLYLAHDVGGAQFMRDVFRLQVIGRLASQYFPVYFYFENSLSNYAVAYPCALFVIGGVLFYRGRLADFDVLIKLTGWMLVILLGMSIPGEKKTRYILPFMPAIALLASYPLSLNMRQRYFYWLKHAMIWMLLFSPSILFVLTLYVTHVIVRTHLAAPVESSIMTFFGVMQIISLVLYFSVNKKQGASMVLVCALFTYLFAFFKIVEPLEFAIDNGRDFVMKVEKRRVEKHAKLVFYREGRDGLPIKYLVNMPVKTDPVFINDDGALLAYQPPAFFVTTNEHFEGLAHDVKRYFDVIESGRLGHSDLIVFRRKS